MTPLAKHTRLTRPIAVLAAFVATLCIAAAFAIGSGGFGLPGGGSASVENLRAADPQCTYLKQQCLNNGAYCSDYMSRCRPYTAPISPY